MHFIQVATQDGDLAGLAELDQAAGRHGGEPVVAAAEDGQTGDVADTAIGEAGQHRQLLPAVGSVQAARAGQDFDGFQGRLVQIVAQAFGDPGVDDAGGQAGRGETLAAFVRDLAERLLENQAGVRVDRIGTAAQAVAGELEEIGGRVVATQAELEAGTAIGRAVTGARSCSRRH